ncbi:hypothetical protein M409DRAFT_36175 [Zasmidium cellare ATCC 36951]|uniref:NAD(P)-binding domain-containing protein n=1 Tax=Zasmidium cellare ATCC 36951 TaxID=1080233 RepID=A0A6A6CUG7_ZASCE|nr:uncharacterized protein M409DRAFT_36175 [Zasmidium cellare ATCC 36951]KAF2169462.1 hypothetical protein M409DRAFT_36175 [Zasmidium cellare ATCC 36951]
MAKYAKDQPSGFENAIKRIAIVGAGGTVGAFITAALSNTPNHTLTALTRPGSTAALPSHIKTFSVDYTSPTSLTTALQNQQLLIITLSPTAPRDTHSKLVQAAARAGVKYIIPNGYGPDIENTKHGEDILLGAVARAQREEVERLGMQWVEVCCGFFYDYSLAGGEARFGFDFEKRSLTVYDDGNTKISTSTLSQVGRAVAKMLSLKILPKDEDDGSLTLSRFLNNGVFFNSFVVSQNDMFRSVKRVTGTTDADWTITYEDTRTRYEQGLALVKQGNMSGFGKLLYSRSFFPDDPSDMSAKSQNELLGLPKEDLDEATRGGIEMVKALNARPERMAS